MAAASRSKRWLVCSQRVGHSARTSSSTRTSASRAPLALTDAQVSEFSRRGFVQLAPLAVPACTHDAIVAALDDYEESKGNPGNNLLVAVPLLSEILDAPEVRGGLKSLLGPSYALHPHQHAHLSRPGRKPQHLHRDSYFGFACHRHHAPMWLQLLYYPQVADLPMGPTSLVPKSHFFATEGSFDAKVVEHKAVDDVLRIWKSCEHREKADKGVVILMHYDLWHRGTANIASKPGRRWLLRFQYVRVEAPAVKEIPAAMNHVSDSVMSQWVTAWVRGSVPRSCVKGPENALRTRAEISQLCSDAERIPAAYDLGMHENGLAVLLHTLVKPRVSNALLRAARYGIAAGCVHEVWRYQASSSSRVHVPVLDSVLDVVSAWHANPAAASCALASLVTVQWSCIAEPQCERVALSVASALNSCIADFHAADSSRRGHPQRIGTRNVGACAAEVLGFIGQASPMCAQVGVQCLAHALDALVCMPWGPCPSQAVGETLMACSLAALRLATTAQPHGCRSINEVLATACLRVVRASVDAEVLAFRPRWTGSSPSGDNGLRYALAYAVEAICRLQCDDSVLIAFDLLQVPGRLATEARSDCLQMRNALRLQRWCHFTTSRCPF